MKGHRIRYSRAELAWLEANRLLPIADYRRGFLAAFGRDVCAHNLHQLRKRRGWRTGRTGHFAKGSTPANKGKRMPFNPNSAATRFKKGQLPLNTKYLGHERLSKDGYVEISVAETNPHTGFERRYVLKHKHLWEKANGPVPDGMALKCLGDRSNTDPSNWVLIDRAILPRLNGGPHKSFMLFDQASPELRPAILAVAQLAHRTIRVGATGAKPPKKSGRPPTLAIAAAATPEPAPITLSRRERRKLRLRALRKRRWPVPRRKAA
jgi:hypothetical protein